MRCLLWCTRPTKANWLLFLLLAMTSPVRAAPAEEWRYIAPPPSGEHEHPPLRAMPLGEERPDDLKESLAYRGSSRRYGQLRYGSPGSTRVAVVLDEVAPGEFDLYVDADRSRSIQPAERVTSENRTWRLPLKVAIVEGDETRLIERSMIFRLSASGRTLSYAAAGYLEGNIELDGRSVAVRRQDGDGNGYFTDGQDRLWLDLDGNGQWNIVSEQFLHTTILALGETRYAVRSDELGTRLSLEKLEGSGTVRLVLARTGSDAHQSAMPPDLSVRRVNVMLVGRDGSAFGIQTSSSEITMPIGQYRLGSLHLVLDDPDGGLPWNFVFSDNGGKPQRKWYHLERDQTLTINPIAGFELLTGLPAGAERCRPGEELSLQPRLYTDDGLMINNCFRGDRQDYVNSRSTEAVITLATTDGIRLGAAHSGFA